MLLFRLMDLRFLVCVLGTSYITQLCTLYLSKETELCGLQTVFLIKASLAHAAQIFEGAGLHSSPIQLVTASSIWIKMHVKLFNV